MTFFLIVLCLLAALVKALGRQAFASLVVVEPGLLIAPEPPRPVCVFSPPRVPRLPPPPRTRRRPLGVTPPPPRAPRVVPHPRLTLGPPQGVLHPVFRLERPRVLRHRGVQRGIAQQVVVLPL